MADKGDSSSKFKRQKVKERANDSGNACFTSQNAKMYNSEDYSDIFASFLKDEEVVEPLRDVLEIFSLGSSKMTLCSFRILDCNAGTDLGFEDATFNIATNKISEPILKVKLFNISDLFTPGMSLLHKFLRRERPVIPKDPLLRKALANLIKFVVIPGYLGDHEALNEECADKGEWAIKVAQHLLLPLSVASTYTMDNLNQNLKAKLASSHCVCNSHDKLTGKLGDTSFGCKFWHGRVDVLMNDALPVSIAEEEESEFDEYDEPECFVSEIKTSEKPKDMRQMIAETIVFSFLQQKKNNKRNDLNSSLIPGIEISKKKLKILFYDSVEDVLLSSASLDLLDVYQPQLTAIVLLWLTLNYKLFCTGITEEMKMFKADFFKMVPPEVLAVYRNDVTLPYLYTGNQPNDGNWAQHNVRHVKNFRDIDDTGYEPV